MEPNQALKRNVGRTIEFARTVEAGKDLIIGKRNSGAAQQILVETPLPPAEITQRLKDLTVGTIGAAWTSKEQWGAIHLRQLPADWDDTVQELILESFVIQVATFWDLYVEKVTGGVDKRKFVESLPTLAPRLKEFRATRNCLIHNGRLADQEYFDMSGNIARVKRIGDQLPLDWEYCYSQAAIVLEAGEETDKRKT